MTNKSITSLSNSQRNEIKEMNRRMNLKHKDPYGKAVKQLEREEIERQTKEFLESGKKINFIETGASGETDQILTAKQKYRIGAEQKEDREYRIKNNKN